MTLVLVRSSKYFLTPVLFFIKEVAEHKQMGKRIKRKIKILLRFVRQVVRGVACHAMFTTYDYSIGLKAIYLTFLK